MFLTEAQKIQVIERYQNGESMSAIAADLGVSPTPVRHALQEAGIPLRDMSEAHRIHTLNEAAFDVITEESAYWIGFLMADGCVSDTGHG